MKWYDILEASFGVRWTGNYSSDMKKWTDELKDTVGGWKNASKDQINDEMCAALRYVSDMEPIPRADDSQKSSKYNCRDVRVWVYSYRERRKQTASPLYVSGVTSFSERLKRYILELLEDNRVFVAEGIANQPFYPENPDGLVQYAHTYTTEEREDVLAFFKERSK